MYSYDKVFPCGALSAKQIERGQEVLNNISEIIINEKNNNDELLFLSNNFFILIPHHSKKLKIIQTHKMIEEKNKLLIFMRKYS